MSTEEVEISTIKTQKAVKKDFNSFPLYPKQKKGFGQIFIYLINLKGCKVTIKEGISKRLYSLSVLSNTPLAEIAFSKCFLSPAYSLSILDLGFFFFFYRRMLLDQPNSWVVLHTLHFLDLPKDF